MCSKKCNVFVLFIFLGGLKTTVKVTLPGLEILPQKQWHCHLVPFHSSPIL